MALFRRRSTDADPPTVDEVVPPPELNVPDARKDGYDRAGGPFDELEVSQVDDSLTRVDLGSLLVPGVPGLGIQVEADPTTHEVRAVTAVGEQAAVQLQPFAAPRHDGVWDEIRAEMLAELGGASGAGVSEHVGSFGPELHAVLPTKTAEGEQVQQPVRFVGIDGPRWFLRVVFLGRAAVEPDPEDALHQLVRQTVVVRGAEAMAPRDPLPLTLPAEALDDGEDVDEDDDDDDSGADVLNPFERGPEITETR